MVIKANTIKIEVGPIPENKKKGVIYFSTIDDLNKVLTPKKIKLLDIIKEKHPESIYQLATFAERDQGNVTKEINELKKYGFVTIQKTKEGKRQKSKPEVEEEAIEMVIKLGAGLFGLAKESFEEVSEEFKGKKLDENKKYVKDKYKDITKPLKKTVKKIAKEFDIVTK